MSSSTSYPTHRILDQPMEITQRGRRAEGTKKLTTEVVWKFRVAVARQHGKQRSESTDRLTYSSAR